MSNISIYLIKYYCSVLFYNNRYLLQHPLTEQSGGIGCVREYFYRHITRVDMWAHISEGVICSAVCSLWAVWICCMCLIVISTHYQSGYVSSHPWRGYMLVSVDSLSFLTGESVYQYNHKVRWWCIMSQTIAIFSLIINCYQKTNAVKVYLKHVFGESVPFPVMYISLLSDMRNIIYYHLILLLCKWRGRCLFYNILNECVKNTGRKSKPV